MLLLHLKRQGEEGTLIETWVGRLGKVDRGISGISEGKTDWCIVKGSDLYVLLTKLKKANKRKVLTTSLTLWLVKDYPITLLDNILRSFE